MNPEELLSPSSVLAAVWNEKGEILCVKRRDPLIWVLPGGGIDPGETEETAILREVQEESGLIVSIIRKAAVYIPINRLTQVTSLYECRKEGGSLSISDETVEVGFFPIEELPQPFFVIHKEWLRESILEKRKGTLFQKARNVTYLRLFFYFLRHPIQVVHYLWRRCS